VARRTRGRTDENCVEGLGPKRSKIVSRNWGGELWQLWDIPTGGRSSGHEEKPGEESGKSGGAESLKEVVRINVESGQLEVIFIRRGGGAGRDRGGGQVTKNAKYRLEKQTIRGVKKKN